MQLNNNNFRYIDPTHLPNVNFVLTLSCQNERINDTRRCQDPPGLNTSSLLALNKRFTHLSVIDVQNTGLSDAFEVTIQDLLPDQTDGGMCDLTPEILGAQVVARASRQPDPSKRQNPRALRLEGFG